MISHSCPAVDERLVTMPEGTECEWCGYENPDEDIGPTFSNMRECDGCGSSPASAVGEIYHACQDHYAEYRELVSE